MKQASNDSRRRPYRKPVLREYGDLRRITEANASGGKKGDGSMYGSVALKTSG